MKVRNFSIPVVASLLLASAASGQQGVAINETGASPHASAILDISSINKGVLIPGMTQENREHCHWIQGHAKC